ncbi:MAG: hypothetical protein LBT63_00225 [Holosporaceae bacterium]|jgi:hypothetical protein|nr:hypothetical protein [Holosporaceae bacterium]
MNTKKMLSCVVGGVLLAASAYGMDDLQEGGGNITSVEMSVQNGDTHETSNFTITVGMTAEKLKSFVEQAHGQVKTEPTKALTSYGNYPGLLLTFKDINKAHSKQLIFKLCKIALAAELTTFDTRYLLDTVEDDRVVDEIKPVGDAEKGLLIAGKQEGPEDTVWGVKLADNLYRATGEWLYLKSHQSKSDTFSLSAPKLKGSEDLLKDHLKQLGTPESEDLAKMHAERRNERIEGKKLADAGLNQPEDE